MIGKYVEFGLQDAYIIADGDIRLGLTEDREVLMMFTGHRFTSNIISLGPLELEDCQMPPEDTDLHQDFPWHMWALSMCSLLNEQGLLL